MESQFQCVAASDPDETGFALVMLFTVVACILLANMLIAMMTNTFNNVVAEQEQNFAFNRVREMLYAEDAGALPPPFNLLALPYIAVQGCALCLTGRTDSFVPAALKAGACEWRGYPHESYCYA